MSDDVISLAPPLSVSGPVVSMFAAWRDNLISGAAANAKSRLSEGGGKKEVSGPGSAATSSPLTPHEAEGGSSAPSDWKDLDGTRLSRRVFTLRNQRLHNPRRPYQCFSTTVA